MYEFRSDLLATATRRDLFNIGTVMLWPDNEEIRESALLTGHAEFLMEATNTLGAPDLSGSEVASMARLLREAPRVDEFDVEGRSFHGRLAGGSMGHHRPDRACVLVGQGDGGDLGLAPCQQTGQPRPAPAAGHLSSLDHREGSDHQQRSEITVARLGDVPQTLLAAGRILSWHQTDPGRQVTPRSESMWIGYRPPAPETIISMDQKPVMH